MRAIKMEGLKPTYVSTGRRFGWGGARWTILNPPAGAFAHDEDDAANASVAYLLAVNGVQALFTGDVEPAVETAIAQRLAPLIDDPVEIFMATHHGSRHGSTDPLLDIARPRWAVLSTGGNRHGHPHPT